MRFAWLVVVISALLLVGAGCGGGDDEASDDTEVTVTETTTDETTTDDETDTTTDDVDVSGILGDEDCLQLASIGATFAQAITGATDDEAAEAFQELVDEVPGEIQADLQVLADWFADYAAEIRDIGIEEGQVPTAAQLQQLQAALAATDQAELNAASERLQAWATENCEGTGG